MWGTFLSEPLRIVGLVGRRPANYLMRRMPIPDRNKPFPPGPCGPGELWGIRRGFPRLFPSRGQVAYVLLTSAPVAVTEVLPLPHAAPRLACVKPVASVHPEPGSNSSLLLSCFLFFSESMLETSTLTLPSAATACLDSPVIVTLTYVSF